MVSANTLLRGRNRQDEALCFHYKKNQSLEVSKTYALSPEHSGFVKRSAILLAMLFSSFFLSNISAQCIADCSLLPATVELDSDGSVPLCTFFDNCSGLGCATFDIAPASVKCIDIGSTIPVTVTATRTDGQVFTCSTNIGVTDLLGPDITSCPADVIVQCGTTSGIANTDPAMTGTATATDNCSSVTITYSDPGTGNCGMFVRTWAAEDGLGNISNCTQMITVEDNSDPVLTLDPVPADITLDCDQVFPVYGGTITATDNCAALTAGDVTMTDTPVNQGANPTKCDFYSYDVERKWRVEDDCGNADSIIQIITVQDTTAPSLVVSTNHPVVAAGNCEGMVMVSATSSDCAASANLINFFWVVQVTTGDTIDFGSGLSVNKMYNAGMYNFIFNSTDPCGNTGEATGFVEILDAAGPTARCKDGSVTVNSFTGMSNIPVPEIDNGSSDNCPGALVYTLSQTTVGCGDIGPLGITLTVTDANANSNTCTGNLEVLRGTPTALCDTIEVDLDASGQYTLTQTDINTLGALSVDMCNAGALTFLGTLATYDCDDIGSNTALITVENDASLTSTCNATVKVRDMMSPMPTCDATADVYLDENGRVNVTGGMFFAGTPELLMATGAATGSTDFTVRITENTTLTFDYSFSKNTPHAGDRFGYRVDGNSFVWLVSGTSTSVSNPISVSLSAGDLFRIRLRTTSNAGGRAEAVITGIPFDVSGDFYAPNWQSLSRNVGSAFVGSSANIDNCTSPYDLAYAVSPSTFTCDSMANSPHTITVTVTDEAGNEGTCTTDVTVKDDLAPVFECQDFSAQLSASSNGSVTVEAGWLMKGSRSIFLDGGGNSSFITGTTSYAVPVKAADTLTFNWDFESTDTTVSEEQFGYFIDTTFTQLNTANSQVNQTTIVILAQGQTFGFRMITDNDSETAIASVSGLTFTGDYDPVKWTRTLDNSLGSGRVFIHGELSDNCTKIEDLVIEMENPFNQGNGDYGFSYPFNCFTGMNHSSNVRVTDKSLNVFECGANITIIDNVAPQASCPVSFATNLNSNGEFIASDNNGLVNHVFSFSSDNCFINDVTFSPDTLTCKNIGSNDVTVMVEDGAGNIGTCITAIVIQETSAPSILCPGPMVIECINIQMDTMPVNSGMATGSDNCSATLISYIDTLVSRNGPNCFEFNRVWKATDGSGNSVTCAQNFRVTDANAPAFDLTNFVGSIFAECDSVPAPVRPPIDVNSSCGVYVSYDTMDVRYDYSNGVDTFFAGSKPGEQGHYNYRISRTWILTDSCGNSNTVGQTVIVSDADSPEINFPDSIVVNTDPGMCRANVSLALAAADITDCVPFANLTISNDGLVGDGEADASGFYQSGETFVEFTVQDYDNAPSTHTVKVVVKDVATPSLACRADTLNLSLSSDGTASIVLSDVVSSASDNCGVDSISIMPSNFTCAELGVNQVDVDAFDEAGNSATCVAYVRVITSAAVGGISCPGVVTVDCSASIDTIFTGVPTFNTMGACGNSTLTFSDAVTSGNSRCGEITRTFTISNGTAVNTCTQSIMVEDNLAPRFLTDVPTDTIHECTSIPSFDLVAKDSCSGTFAVTPVDDTTGYNVNPTVAAHYNYTILREWIAEDGCGNSSLEDQNITVQDSKDPVISFPNPLVIPTSSNSCDTMINLDLADYIADACAGDDYLIYEIDGNTQRYVNGTFAPGTYTYSVKVTDPSGNSDTKSFVIEIEDQQTPDAICIQNVVITLDNTGNASINPDKVDAGSTDNCTPSNMLTRSVVPSSFDTGDIGPVQVTLTVSDAAGLTRTCVANATVVGGTIISADNAVSPEGGMDSVGVSIANFQDVTTFDFEVSASDDGVADVTDIVDIHPDLDANGLLIMTAITNGYFIQWIDTTTVGTPGITLPDGTTLFNLEIDVTGTDGDMTDVVVGSPNVSKFIGGFATPSASSGVDGSVTVVNMTSLFTLSGTISSETNVLANNVLVDLSGTVSGSQTTTTAGTFNFSVTAGADATIEPGKNTDWTEGVTTADAFYTLQHVAGTRLFQSPYVRIAADANNDNDVTTFDGFQILQLAVGNLSSLSGNTSWRYVPATPVLPFNPFAAGFDEDFNWGSVASDSLQIDFIAIKTADVDSSANAAAKNANRSAFLMSVENQKITASGLTIEVPVKARNFMDVNTIQTSINFDNDALELLDVIPGVLPNFSKGNINDKYADAGLLATGWLNMEPVTLDDDEVLFTLVFQSKEKGFEIQNVLKATADLISQEVIQADEKLGQVDFVFESVSSVATTSAIGFNVRQNVPNPFAGQTLIGFTLPQGGSVQLNVTDASGKVLKVVSGEFPQGYNEVSLDRKDLPNAGVYFYHVQSDFGTATRKMILMD